MKKRGAFIAVSALVHAVFVYWFVHISFPIRVVYEKSEIQEVIIAPPEMTLIAPSRPGIGPAGAFAGSGSPMPVQGQGSMPRKNVKTMPQAFIPEASGPLPEKSSQGDGLILPMVPKGTGKNLNLKRYLDPHFQGWSDLPGLPSAMSGNTVSGSGDQSVGITGNFSSADLQLWARFVVKQVNQNWIIPLDSLLPSHETVAIVVTVNKKGNIIDTAMKTRAVTERFNEIALAAIRLTHRLPPLPVGFSQETLQATLFFQYGT